MSLTTTGVTVAAAHTVTELPGIEGTLPSARTAELVTIANLPWILDRGIELRAITDQEAAEIAKISSHRERIEKATEVHTRSDRNEISRDLMLACGVALPELNRILDMRDESEHRQMLVTVEAEFWAGLRDSRGQNVSRGARQSYIGRAEPVES